MLDVRYERIMSGMGNPVAVAITVSIGSADIITWSVPYVEARPFFDSSDRGWIDRYVANRMREVFDAVDARREGRRPLVP